MKTDRSTGRDGDNGSFAWANLDEDSGPNYNFFRALGVVFLFCAITLGILSLYYC